MIDANDWSWDQHYETGRQCLERKSFDEAEAALVAALRLAEEFDEKDPRLPQTLNMLARVHRAQRRYVAAAAMLQQLAALLERTVGSAHPQLAGVLANLAELYAVMGEREDELSLRERVLDLRRGLGENDPAILAKMEERISQLREDIAIEGEARRAAEEATRREQEAREAAAREALRQAAALEAATREAALRQAAAYEAEARRLAEEAAAAQARAAMAYAAAAPQSALDGLPMLEVEETEPTSSQLVRLAPLGVAQQVAVTPLSGEIHDGRTTTGEYGVVSGFAPARSVAESGRPSATRLAIVNGARRGGQLLKFGAPLAAAALVAVVVLASRGNASSTAATPAAMEPAAPAPVAGAPATAAVPTTMAAAGAAATTRSEPAEREASGASTSETSSRRRGADAPNRDSAPVLPRLSGDALAGLAEAAARATDGSKAARAVDSLVDTRRRADSVFKRVRLAEVQMPVADRNP